MKPEATKPASILDLMTPEDLAKVKAREQRQYDDISTSVSLEWMMLAELGFYFGWEAVKALENDEMTIDKANMLIQGARKVHSGHVYDSAVAALASNARSIENFNKLMKVYIDDMEVKN